ncbi:phasin family protein [Pseudothauera rhizosphaerae]|uniref:Phasin family protein n=1 Tax=Pseudothauera rhizosphaerae TaxID=2565932 RepID=A0A4S4AYT5_9RHOO|nr:phasin family protein [Pseudothauera rhizosphaerae]THF65163.1 phasin family protein [Pseudothauera rhizosphaerae]
MSSSNEHFSAIGRQSLESLEAIGSSVLKAAEQSLGLHLQTARSLFEHSLSSVRGLSESGDASAYWSSAPALAQPGIEHLVSWSQGLYEIASRTQQELGRHGESLLSEISKSLSGLLDQAARHAPSGSEHGIAAVKSALSATRSTLDNISQASRKVAEIADANVAAASQAAIKSSSGSSSGSSSSRSSSRKVA